MKDAHIREKEITTTNIKYLVVEGDAIDIIRFPLVRMYEGHDLYDAVITCFFEFEDGSGDADILTKELSPGGELVYAHWQVKGNATSRSGKLKIQLRAVKSTTVIWQTKPTTIYVEGSLSPDELGEFTPTILDQYMALYQGLVDDAETARDRAREWAEKTEGEAVEPGSYSAKHYVAKAKEWSEKAENEPVESGLYSAKHHAAKAKEWSEKAEDEPVEPGFYSAKHYAAKSAEHATLIYDHLAAVMPHQIVDHDNLVTYRANFKMDF